MTPDDIKTDLELALLTQSELLAYLADIRAWYALVHDSNEVWASEYATMVAAEREAWSYCNHQGTRLMNSIPGNPHSAMECQTCWRNL